MALIILKQILVMSIYMLIGYLLYKSGKITDEGSRSFAGIMAYIIIPSTVLTGLLVEYTPERMKEFGLSFLMGLLTILIAIVISALIFRDSGMDRFAAAFSNCGFIGIPLIRAAIGDAGVFCLVGLLIWFNVLQWVYGMDLLRPGSGSEKKKTGISPARFFRTPVVIAAIVGFAIFALRLGDRLPSVISDCVNGIAAMNAPFAMVVLGVYLAQSRISELFTTKRLYLVSAVRLIVIPLVTVFALAFLPVSYNMKMTMIIAGAAPVGVNIAVYSQICDADYVYACKTVTQSTLFSVIIMPLIILIAELVVPH